MPPQLPLDKILLLNCAFTLNINGGTCLCRQEGSHFNSFCLQSIISTKLLAPQRGQLDSRAWRKIPHFGKERLPFK